MYPWLRQVPHRRAGRTACTTAGLSQIKVNEGGVVSGWEAHTTATAHWCPFFFPALVCVLLPPFPVVGACCRTGIDSWLQAHTIDSRCNAAHLRSAVASVDDLPSCLCSRSFLVFFVVRGHSTKGMWFSRHSLETFQLSDATPHSGFSILFRKNSVSGHWF